jgi:hypothetical protein
MGLRLSWRHLHLLAGVHPPPYPQEVIASRYDDIKVQFGIA